MISSRKAGTHKQENTADETEQGKKGTSKPGEKKWGVVVNMT